MHPIAEMPITDIKQWYAEYRASLYIRGFIKSLCVFTGQHPDVNDLTPDPGRMQSRVYLMLRLSYRTVFVSINRRIYILM